MYCIECGEQILGNSKFCSHCGKQQIEEAPSIIGEIIENERIKQAVTEHNKSLDYDFLRKAMGWYLAWVVLHLGLLLVGSEAVFTNKFKTDDFWPIMDSRRDGGLGEYDIREFLVYTIFPLAILIIWSMIRTQNKKEE
jgi:hypothetical protein